MTLPGNPAYGAPQDPITALVRRIEDLERTVKAMSTLLVNGGTLQVNDPNSGSQVFYVGPGGMNDGSGREQAVVYIHRQDGTIAMALFDGGTAPGHTIQQALQFFDKSGNIYLADDGDGQGLARPYIPIGFFTDAIGVPTATTTSASFVTLQTLIGFKQHPKVQGQIEVYADVGTTGTVQVVDQSSNVLFTTNLTSGQFGYVSYGPVALAGTHEQAISLNIQGKVLTGAGKVGVRGVAAIGVQT